MKSIFISFILIILVGISVGCERRGYIITIKTNEIKYDDLQQIGIMLKDRDFKTLMWERKKDMEKYPNEVFTLFEKKVNGKHYYFVDVYLEYIKEVPNNIAVNLRLDIHNVYKGGTITELKDEIDKIGDMVYQELIDKVGEKNVEIERKEAPDRIILF